MALQRDPRQQWHRATWQSVAQQSNAAAKGGGQGGEARGQLARRPRKPPAAGEIALMTTGQERRTGQRLLRVRRRDDALRSSLHRSAPALLPIAPASALELDLDLDHANPPPDTAPAVDAAAARHVHDIATPTTSAALQRRLQRRPPPAASPWLPCLPCLPCRPCLSPPTTPWRRPARP
ncbi:hypothetical protein SVAN01_09536, partial [Stagonosporopsis vannaccii]